MKTKKTETNIEALKAALLIALAALERAGDATAHESHDDSVGYHVCCQVVSYLSHRNDCYIMKAIQQIKETIRI